MDIKHRHTKPYRPQTNGKTERFWNTRGVFVGQFALCKLLQINNKYLKNELLGFLVYYNEHRPHSALDGLTPKEFLQKTKV